ncbi:MAG: hypothetical protein HZC17_04720 [Candidatus Omnitrophica bacterium]|nr:hypothetical protein [Candidatus Omnitrophota bacterium]
MRQRLFLIYALALFFVLSTRPLFAAEVYYLGPEAYGNTGEITTPQNISFEKRAKDLIDFGAYGESKPDRTGQISGSVLSEVYWNGVSGNKANSFLPRGAHYLDEVHLNGWERLWKDYRFEARTMTRKTDDPRIEIRRDLRLKDINLRVYNPKNMLEFGDIYGDFTNFTLASTLEGFRGDFKPFSENERFQFVAARSHRSNVTQALYQRDVFGGKADVNFMKNKFLFSNIRLGGQVVTNQDDTHYGWAMSPAGVRAQDLYNTVFSLDGNADFKKYVGFHYEWARSMYTPDKHVTNDQVQYGNALQIDPSFRSKYGSFRYLYYYVQPSFYTDTGSASTDKVQHQFNLDVTPINQIRLSLVENYYWNHLERSPLTYRTVNNEKYSTLYLRPFEQRRSFDIRTYFNYLSAHSDNFPYKSVDNYTTTTGVSVNDRIWDTNIGTRYEYRGYFDRININRPDIFNRFGANMSRDFRIFNRRLYFSGDFAFDFHDAKAEDDNEITATQSMNAEYDLFERFILRGGMNIQNYNAAAPVSGYTNRQNFLETDLLLAKKRGTHFITRIERNVYANQDTTQDYKELRVVARLVSQF